MSDSSFNRSSETTPGLPGETEGIGLRRGNSEPAQTSALNCHDFESRVQELLDARRRPDSDSRIRVHAEHCQDCRLLLTQFRRLESVLERSLQARTEHQFGCAKTAPFRDEGLSRLSRRSSRPVHPVSRSHRVKLDFAARAAVLVLLAGFAAFQIGFSMKRQEVLLPMPRTGGPMFVAGTQLSGSGSGIRPVANYRSLEQCYELTIELPGVRSLQTSILVALDWCRDYFKLDGGEIPEPPHHERGFGLNPLRAEINRQA